MSFKLETHSMTQLNANQAFYQQDLIEPHILPASSLLTLGSTNLYQANHFLFTWMLHMAAGREFLQFKTPYPLRIVYVQKYYASEKSTLLQQHFSPQLLDAANGNLLLITSSNLSLEKNSIELLINKIETYFGHDQVDIIVLDPLHRLLPDYIGFRADPNPVRTMASFLNRGLEVLRQRHNSDLGFILTHDVEEKRESEDKSNAFRLFSPKTCIHDFSTTRLILNYEDNLTSNYTLYIDRPDHGITESKSMRYINGFWEQRS